MTRLEKILKHIDKNGVGVEIGPIHTPKAPKREGYKVHIIDHLSREELLEKYESHNIDLSKIEEVDFVWKGESYAELTGKRRYYDWLIASHVIEHTPDLIRFLNGSEEILKEEGVISLVVPDKRYCFDHFRPLTGISDVVDSYYHKNTNHTPGTVAEYFLNVVSKEGKISWNPSLRGEYQFVHTVDEAIDGMAAAKAGAFLDTHAWCFTPTSFRLLVHDLYLLGLISVREIEFQLSGGGEFYMTLGRQGQGCPLQRMDMVKAIQTELTESPDLKTRFRWRVAAVRKRLKKYFAGR